MSWLALPLLAVCLIATGLGALRCLRIPASPSFSLAAGAVVLHLTLQLEAVVGIPWSWTHAVLLGAFGAVLAWRLGAPAERHGRRRISWGWGECVALGVLLVLAVLCAGAWIDNPDFIYHWGAKGRKFALSAGLDLAFLGPPSGWHLHPDYPNLLPELYALTAQISGTSSAAPLLLWTPVLCAALLAAAREALAETPKSARQLTLAWASLALLSAVFAFELGGNADPLVAWALLLALPPMLRPDAPGGAARVGIAAALAAASKIEGIPLAVFLIAGFLLSGRGVRMPERSRGTRAAMLVLPAGLVVAPWLWISVRHSLFSSANSGAPSLARLAMALPEMGAVLWSPAWGGLPLTLVALPWLLARRRTRWAALVCLAQLGFYLWVYASAPVDTVLYVKWSFARLLLHVLPTVWVLCALAATEAASAALVSGAEVGDSR